MEDLSPILQMLDQIINDRTVPRNIRKAVSDAKESIVSGEGPLDVRISNAIFILDEITNDPNIPLYTRTQIWNIVSLLEMKKRELFKDEK